MVGEDGRVTPADLVEQMMALPSVDEWLALVHPDAEYQPLPAGAPSSCSACRARAASHCAS